MAKGKQARGGEEPLSKAQEAVQAEVQQAKKVVREKKTFDLPGQIRETPLEVGRARTGVRAAALRGRPRDECLPCRGTRCANSTRR